MQTGAVAWCARTAAHSAVQVQRNDFIAVANLMAGTTAVDSNALSLLNRHLLLLQYAGLKFNLELL
jgi:hypothetical protein